MSKASELYFEVKERIAKHSSMKESNRLLKQGRSKMTAPVDQSSIIDLFSSPSSHSSSPAPVGKAAIAVTSKQEKKTVKQPAEKKGKGKKEKPQPMTPTEYARNLNEKLAAAASNAAESSSSKPKKKASIKYLEGKHIFYTGGDMKHASEMTRGRMDLVRFPSLLFLLRLSSHVSISDCQIWRESDGRIRPKNYYSHCHRRVDATNTKGARSQGS